MTRYTLAIEESTSFQDAMKEVRKEEGNLRSNSSLPVFSDYELLGLDRAKIPKHVAIIMDGNRRWARERNLPISMGHWEGAEVLSEVLQAGAQLGIETITVYAFSTENWGRPKKEVEDLMEIFQLYLRHKKDVMVRDGVKLTTIGDLSKLPLPVLEALETTQRATFSCSKINLVLALNYGGRDEICRAIKKMIKKNIDIASLTEEMFAEHLDTKGYRDPELLIRTSGEMRVSNFLLWQTSYSEFFSSEVLWPDFSPQELLKAIYTFQNRSRRLGG